MELTLEIYRLAKEMPANERFGLSAATPARRGLGAHEHRGGKWTTHRGDYLRFLSIARASLMEVDSTWNSPSGSITWRRPQLRRARDLIAETRMMLSTLTQSISRTIPLHSSLPET